MSYSEDLSFFLDYLPESRAKHTLYVLKKLGFVSDDVRLGFIEKVFENVSIYHSSWMNKSSKYNNYDFAAIVYEDIKNELNFRNSFFGDYKTHPDGSETFFRRISSLIKVVKSDKYVTATDIASYTFCPVSYCIRVSFDEDEPTEESRVGTELHEEHRLVALTTEGKGKHEVTTSGKGKGFYNQYNFEFFDDIKSSKIYYVGHDQSSKRYFKSAKGHFVGQPDYVFVNKAGVRFVVEEKFRPLDKQSNAIKQHHKAQLASYILGLDELETKYGYLVYWYYTYENEKRTVKKCVVFKVEPTVENKELVRNAYRAISILNAGERLKFAPNKLNAAKCASCVVRKFCGHKTGRFDEISVPYGKEFYSLLSA